MRKYLTIVYILFGLLHCSQAFAGILFEQQPDPDIRAGSASTLNYYGKHPGRQSADDFTINESTPINEIIWWGQHAPSSSHADDFIITFYESLNNSPGKILSESHETAIAQPHKVISKLTEYKVVLTKGVSVQSGKKYWLSIFNASPRAAWRWNNSVIGNNRRMALYEPFDKEWQVVNGQYVDASFRLSSVSSQVFNTLLKLAITLLSIFLGWILIRKIQKL